MNQQAILQSSLLDIIFENRNKNFGAYELRKSYQTRLAFAVFFTVGMALMATLLLEHRNSHIILPPHSHVFVANHIMSNYVHEQAPKKIIKPHATVKTIQKIISHPQGQPILVVTNKINNLPATPEFQPSFSSTTESGVNTSLKAGETGNNTLDGNGAPGITEYPDPAKTIPVEIAEVMPQYPGGIEALLLFLKKNVHVPENVEEGEDVTVKIKFVVNYNGNLENFMVIKSGGEIFDNEVLRVLKKMPVWVPGKSNGKNVSVYFIVPVKFTNQF